MFNDADDKEYSRNVTAYEATYQHRNRMYDEAYQIFRDSKTDAYNMANLQLSEHGQLVSDAVNYYNVTSDYANTLYNREYQKWNDEVNQAMQYAQMLNNDYWKQTNYDRGVFESDRAYNRDIFESDRDYNRGVFESDRAYNEGVRQYEQNYAQTEKWNQKDLDYKNKALAQDQTQFDETMKYNRGKLSQEDEKKIIEDSSFTPTEIEKIKEVYIKAGGASGNGDDAVYNHLKAMGKGTLSKEAAEALDNILSNTEVPMSYQNWSMYDNEGNLLNGANDTNNGWWFFGKGDDHNDVYTNGTTTATFDAIKQAIEDSDMDDESKALKLKMLRDQSKK
jgi:hypothetical protein